jgi:hypothetical protein
VFAYLDCQQALYFLNFLQNPWLQPVLVTATLAIVTGYFLAPSDQARVLALAGLVLLFFVVPQVLAILGRPSHYPVHDGILLTDAASGRLLGGLDPYGHDYIDSIGRQFLMPEVPVNFGLGHYVYMPIMILLGVPFHLTGIDQVWLWPIGAALLAWAAYDLGDTPQRARAALIGLGLNPLMLLDGYAYLNDLFPLAMILAAFGQMRRRRPVWAGVIFGLALATKQHAVLFAPLLIAYAWPDRRVAWRSVTAAVATTIVIALPFLAWNPGGFIADTAAFFYGKGVDSYPIRGLSVPGLLLRDHLISNRWAAFAATVPLQVAGVALVLGLWVRYGFRSGAAGWLWTGAFILAVFEPSRVLAPNYLDLGLIALFLGLALGLEDFPPALATIGGLIEKALGHSRVEATAPGEQAGHFLAAQAGQPVSGIKASSGGENWWVRGQHSPDPQSQLSG